MQIEGEIKAIIFNNTVNGYTVASLFCEEENEKVIIVGKFFSINIGERVRLNGHFTTNTKYGEQFAFESFEIIYPTSVNGIKTFLSSGLIKGIGPVTAKKIVDKFGTKSLEILEFSHQKLTEINGISAKKAETIHEYFYNYKNVQNIIVFLNDYGISVNMALKIYEVYKENTIKKIEENPYRLVEDIEGIGFLTADKIAQKFGVKKNSEFRVRAGILYSLTLASERNGHTYLPMEELLKYLEDILSFDIDENMELINSVINHLMLEKMIMNVFNGFEKVICLAKFYYAEKFVADKIAKLNHSHITTHYDVSNEIKHFEQINKIKFNEEQIVAIDSAINEGVCVITGGPGTGKTTIIKCILSILDGYGKKTALLAPTGRASNRITQTSGREASTIHRALAMDFNSKTFSFNENNPLPFNTIIVDEFSMVDILLAKSLLKALNDDCKLIIVGDKDQLPSVGAGNVLDDIINSDCVYTAYLNQIYRQDEKSKIITNAHLINEGKMPDLDNLSKDFFFETKTNPTDIKNSIINLVTERLPNFLKIDPDEIQVLAPMKNGISGIENLNLELQNKLNPPSFRKPEIVLGRTTLRLGDKVMQTANNYNLEWTQEDENHLKIDGTGIFNGDIGFIQSINTQTGEIVVCFENNKLCTYPRTEINQLSLAYAITIHKSQGSEFDVVVMPIISGPSIIINRNLLYTAVTRAKQMVVLVGEKKNLKIMINNKFILKRHTMLKEFLIKSNNNAKLLFS